ncbi:MULTISPECIES: NADH-quinone oxidoreductase subunit C [Streptomyces]|uniref:NADH-quinone oxidoreductase subunit C n=1 Tax=Streptomyces TaxID=1883 RepID=UPI00099FD76D
MNAYDRLPDAAGELFGDGATAERTYDLLTVDVPAASWTSALETARDELRCTYFDWLSAVDEPATGFLVCAHVAALEGGRVRRLLLRTTVPHDAPALPSAVGVYAGAAWHERETYEMFGVTFTGHPHLVPLLLPEGFEGHPLRKDFVLAARVAKAWPGAKEPGESEHGGPKRRQMLPPGVPDPNDWGPLKGQLPPAPARPARAARAAGDRPVRRARTAGEGSASQQAPEATAPQAAGPRRARSASEGSASQAAARATPAGRPAEPAPDTPPTPPRRPRSADAPWNNPRPAFDDAPAPAPEPPAPAPAEPATAPEPAERAEPTEPAERVEPAPATAPPAAPAPQPGPPGPEDTDDRPADGSQPTAGDRAGEGRDAAAAPEPEGSGPRPADRSTDTGTTDTGTTDTGTTDTGTTDTEPADTGTTDTEPAETGSTDTDPGPADPGPTDNRRTNTGGDA